jgi:methylenetetrahydrofolate reductase (NADPH)
VADIERDLSWTISSLASGFSLEVTPREVRKHPGLLGEVLPTGTRVYTTFLPNTPFEETVQAAKSLGAQGMRPVPHLAARSVADVSELDRMVGELASVGVEELLVIAGSLARPVGAFSDSLQVLGSGVLQRHGISRVGVAGHPEGNKDIGEVGLRHALQAKNEFARSTGTDVYLLTQFCFDSAPIVRWERQIRADGNQLPVVIGLPGLASPAGLVKFGLACGVGASLKVLRKQVGGLRKMATTSVYYPDQTLVGLAASLVDDRATQLSGIHFFPFGAVEATVQWQRQIAASRFRIDPDGHLALVAESA